MSGAPANSFTGYIIVDLALNFFQVVLLFAIYRGIRDVCADLTDAVDAMLMAMGVNKEQKRK